MTQQRAETAIALCVEQGFPFWAAWGVVMRGWALAEQGKAEEGIATMREGLAAYEATGAGMGKTLFLSLLADAYGKAGQPEAGLQSLSEAFEFLDKANERAYEAELWRLKGEVTLRSKIQSPKSKVEDAEECFCKAIDIARKQQAKSWELRATTSLARLWQQRKKSAEAHQALSEIYNWFTEGFDTKDLQEAKALIAELRH
jgi:predicted ATPase